MVEPPYLRICEDIRRRITAGELKPGDRLPSTRALAAQQGVAMATAAKALTALRQAGVIRSQPRVGSVVAPPPRSRAGRATPPDTDLNRDHVVRAAMLIADAQGLEALSMRTVAARLGVPTMSLYRHVTGKDDLVLLMTDRAYGEVGYPPVLPDGWRARLELGARTLWRLYARHPWLAQLGSLARPLPLPNLIRHGDYLIGALSGLGLPAARVLDLQILLFSHGQGLAAHREREAHAQADTGLTEQEWGDTQIGQMRTLAESGRYPHFAHMLDGLGDGYDFDLDALFEAGLQALLDGFAHLIDREGS
ncbi:GntR family transcriptional regulator [Actinoplanes rectilineatus]|uniref:GntR family transcriptional regulator n=1 Tax=Actinoplanes rectilineatus TaxID=113571 RepID=UPI0005F27977|nr:GntR family transcriptional regulator [Actinoplanes rectilineatus]